MAVTGKAKNDFPSEHGPAATGRFDREHTPRPQAKITGNIFHFTEESK